MTATSAPSFRWAFLFLLGLLTFSPIGASAGMTPDEVKKFEEVKAKAEMGDASAQHMAGFCYALELGVKHDMLQAFNWYRKSADQGYAEGLHQVGLCYSKGWGVPKNEVEGYAFICLAAVTNDFARDNLASLEASISRAEVAAGQKRALELRKEIDAKIATKKAGKQANPIKESKPPVVLARSEPPVAVSRASSFDEIKAAAEHGDMMAQFIMGDYYSLPVGDIVRDDDVGFSWYLKAARQGLLAAQVKVWSQYCTGLGTKRDYVEAYAWSVIAATGGDEVSRRASQQIYVNMLSRAQEEPARRRREQLSSEIAAEKDARKGRTGK